MRGEIVVVLHKTTTNYMDFPNIQFGVGVYVNQFVSWLQKIFGSLFDAVASGMLWLLLQIENIMFHIPWYVIIAVIFVLG